MAKSKEQKRIEAHWRKIRLDLVQAYRGYELGLPEHPDDREWVIAKQEKAWVAWLELPLDWRLTAMNDWSIPTALRQRLDTEQVARAIEQSTPQASASVRRRRL